MNTRRHPLAAADAQNRQNPAHAREDSFGLTFPAELVEAIAERAADLLADRVARGQQADTGYLDVGGAAEFLSCSASRIYALVSARRIPFHKDGSRVLFDRGELRDYVNHGGAKCP